MGRVLRGQVYWADLGATRGHEQAGRRPVLILSHTEFNERSGTAIVAAITSRPQRVGFPLAMPIKSPSMPKPWWLKLSQIRTIATDRLADLIGIMDESEVVRAVAGLTEIVA